MKQCIIEVLNNLAVGFFKLLPAIILSAIGGFARTWYGKPRGEKYKFNVAIPEIVIAVFSGIVMHYICRNFEMPDNLTSATIALSGYSARGVLTVLEKTVISKVKKFTK